RARPLEVLKPHPGRREPPCPWFMVCGGCQYMHAAYDLQLELKTAAALETLQRNSRIPCELRPSPHALFYRDRVRLHAGVISGRPRIGFFAARTNRLIPIKFCFQLHPRLNLILPALEDWLERLSFGGVSAAGLEVLAGPPAEGLMLVLNLNQKPSPEKRRLIEAGPNVAEKIQVHASVKGRLQVSGKTKAEPRGITWLRLEEPDLRLTAWPTVFTQVNSAVNRLLAVELPARARETAPGRVLDLYAGFGNLTLPLAAAAQQVVAVENNPYAHDNALFNLRLNRLKNVSLLREDAVEAAKALAERGQCFDLIVLDPPRAGAGGLAIYLARLAPARIFYLSCHPAAMVRDLAEFASLGYRPQNLTAFDMFPQTAHVEVLACLAKD
ncbi:MAG: 23S rRNA (uracil(1939)-C(5))-methyltransferase RlmD, partial [Pseudomonadota bacterium]